jgi:nitric oxide reductase large subunit
MLQPMFWLGLITLAFCLWLMAKKQRQTPQEAARKKENFLDWLLTGGLAVFLLLVFRVGWVQAFLRLHCCPSLSAIRILPSNARSLPPPAP